MRAVLLSLCLLWVLTSLSQTVLTGTVRDEVGEPVEMVLVSVLNPADSTIVGYASTDEQGTYAITLTDCKFDTLLLRMDGFNVRRENRSVENRSQRVDWVCKEENTLLREVQVKAQKLWGSKDTLNYLVAAYTRDHDVTIGDVLKRLPGIDIRENGSITYQGIPISKFYIENMDALEGKYNIATRGIKAGDVATVQVLEHHQHVRALDDQVPPEAAAINLKLRKEKKGVWTRSAEVGLGASDRFLWDITGQAMFFGKREQHILIYGTENDGRGSDLLTSHYGGSGVSGEVVTSVTSAPGSPIGNNRRNNYHQLASNNLLRLNDSTELHIDASYKHDLVRTQTDRITTYMLPDGNDRVLAEDLTSRNTQNEASVNVSYERNTKQEYLQNKLDLTGHWSDASNTAQTMEQGQNHTLGVADRIHWVHRTDRGGGFDLQCRNIFSSTPQSLTVSPGVFRDQLADGQPYISANQTATINSFSSANTISMVNDLHRHRLTFAPTAHANIDHRSITAMLHAGREIGGDMKYTHLDLGAGLSIRYTLRQFNAQLHLPLSIQPAILSGSNHSTPGCTRLYFSPSSSFSWRISNNWSSNGNVGWSCMPSSWQQLFTAYVLRSYSNLSRYEGDIYDTESLSGRLKLDYKEILRQVFAWVELSGSRTSADMTYGSHINEQGYSEMQMLRQPHTDTNLQLQASIRKDFDWKNLSLEAGGSTSRGNSQFLRQDVLTRCTSQRYAFSAKVGLMPVKWLDVRTATEWNRFDSHNQEGLASRTTTNWNSHLSLSSTLVEKHLWLTMNATHAYSNLLMATKHHAYLSAQLRYHLRKTDFTLTADNLLNTRSFSTLTISDMTECYTTYHLQPLTVMLKTSVHF